MLWRTRLGGAALLAVVVWVAYFPALRGGFLLDDDNLVVVSRLVHASDGLYQFWCTTNAADYWPVTNSSFWLEWRLWGANPTGYHVTNLLLHLAAALLIWTILRKLEIPGAYLAAMLFAVHPVNVESVAWISQRKNSLAMVFFLLSILWYLRAEERPGATDKRRDSATEENSRRREGQFRGKPTWGPWYWLSLLAFVLAMLSKGSVAVLPVVLLLIIGWQRRRIEVSDLFRTAPFFVVAMVLTGVNVWFQRHGIDVVVRDVNIFQRLAGAGAIVWFYLSKALAPIHLVFVYPQWDIDAGRLAWWLPLAAALSVTALLAWQFVRRKSGWRRALLFGWLLFCAALVPVLGFTDVGFMQYSLVADHYQHIAIIAVSAILAAAWAIWHKQASGAWRATAALTAVALVAGLTFLTYQQNRLYGKAIDLYQDTVNQNPDCWMAHNNLGTSLLDIDRLQEALPHIQRALQLKPESPAVHYNLGYALESAGQSTEAIKELQLALRLKTDFPEAHNNLGNAFRSSGRIPEAIEQYNEALQQRPDYIEAHNNLGNALMKAGQPQAAITHIQEAVRLAPQLPEAHNNLGLALSNSGHFPEAIEEFRRATALKPDFSAAYSNLGFALAATGRVREAIDQYHQALRLNSGMPEAYENLGLALANVGQFDEAVQQYQHALKLKPEDAELRNILGNALFKMGRATEAIAQYQQALRIKPDYVDAYNGLGAALLLAGRPQEAVEQYQQALRLKPDYAEISNNLAAAYVQLQRPADAIAAAQRGVELARAQGQTALAEQLEQWLNSYRDAQAKAPARSPPSEGAPSKP